MLQVTSCDDFAEIMVAMIAAQMQAPTGARASLISRLCDAHICQHCDEPLTADPNLN